MANRTQRKIMQTRNILILVILGCAARLIKLFKDGEAETVQVVGLACVMVILGIILGLYIFIDRYTREEQKTYEDSNGLAEKLSTPQTATSFKGIFKEIFKNDRSGK